MPSTDPFSFTDFEEGILFDQDDPDFGSYSSSIDSLDDKENYFGFTVGSRAMSLTSLAASNRSHSFSSISSLDDRHPSEPTVLSIEELRNHLHSCFTCGVSWHEDHVSLDCVECGGYSLERPCAQCDGKCRSTWKRDLTMSHASGKARWLGECAFNNNNGKSDASDRILKPIHTSDESSHLRRINF